MRICVALEVDEYEGVCVDVMGAGGVIAVTLSRFPVAASKVLTVGSMSIRTPLASH
jgi:hypothetical protein